MARLRQGDRLAVQAEGGGQLAAAGRREQDVAGAVQVGQDAAPGDDEGRALLGTVLAPGLEQDQGAEQGGQRDLGREGPGARDQDDQDGGGRGA